MKKIIASFQYAFRGIADLIRTERHGRFHAVAAIVVITAGLLLHLSACEWIAVILCISLVASLEAMNTAIEHLTNLVSPDYHPLAGRAKDVAAGAVLLAATGAAAVGLIIFLPKVLALTWN